MGGDLRHFADVVMALFVLGTTTIGVFRPVTIARWVRQAHPSIDENDQAVLLFIRLICVVGLCFSLVFSMVIIRSLGI